MVNFLRKKRSVVYSWVISYALILIIPLIANAIVFMVAKDIIETEINTSNELIIDRIQNDIDMLLENVERFSMEASNNARINEVAAMAAIDDGVQAYKMFEAVKDLRNYKMFNHSVKIFYVYFNNLKMVVSPNEIAYREDFYNLNLVSEDYPMEQWLEAMENGYREKYTIMAIRDDSTASKSRKAIGFMRSVPIARQGGDPLGSIVVLLDFDDILNGSEKEFNIDRSLYIMDQNGEILAGKDDEKAFSGLDYKEMDGQQGNLQKNIDGKKVVVSYTTSRVYGWKYITVTPESLFWGKAQTIRNIMVLGVAICVLIGIFIAYYSLKKNYNPLKNIVLFFKQQVSSEESLESNEYGFIQKAFSDTLNEKEIIRLKVEQQNRELKSRFIEALIKGRETEAPIHELMTAYNISYPYKHFIIMTIHIKSTDKEFWKEERNWNINEYVMSRFIITNTVEELINREWSGNVTEIDDFIACIVNLDSKENEYETELIKIAEEARAFIEENYKISLGFSIGLMHKSLEGVPESYREAMRAMEYGQVMGMNKLVSYRDISMKAQNQYYYPAEKEYQLINCIKSTDYEATAVILEEIFQKNLVNSTLSLEMARCLMFDLFGTILKTANELEKIENLKFIEDMNPASELMNCKTFSEMKLKMLEIIKNTCEYVARNNEQMDFMVRDTVLEVIKSNYMDPNLGIASIADIIGKYPYYVSKIFKEQTGESILEYINRVRILKAKDLLKDNTLTQEEIAERVGYTNVRTFQRVFKKIEGTSPGKLKD